MTSTDGTEGAGAGFTKAPLAQLPAGWLPRLVLVFVANYTATLLAADVGTFGWKFYLIRDWGFPKVLAIPLLCVSRTMTHAPILALVLLTFGIWMSARFIAVSQWRWQHLLLAITTFLIFGYLTPGAVYYGTGGCRQPPLINDGR
jgi:hypothetical protein